MIRNLKRIAASAGLLCIGIVLSGCGGALPHNQTKSSSSSSLAEYIKEYKQDAAEFYGLQNPPDVEPVRFVDVDERQELLETCLLEGGAKRNKDGTFSAGDNIEVLNRLYYACDVKFPLRRKYSAPLELPEKKRQYMWDIEYVLPCVKAHGYTLSDPPSEQKYLDTWDTDRYFPLGEVEQVYGPAALADLQEKCLQQAPGAVVWDGLSVADWKKLARGGWWTGE